jgi:hypothetical protein
MFVGSTPSALANDIENFATCLGALARFSGYIDFAESQGEELPEKGVAAYEADMLAYVQMGIERFGEESVSALTDDATDPDEKWINASIALYYTEGAVPTFDRLAKVIAPCGGPSGHLTQRYGS